MLPSRNKVIIIIIIIQDGNVTSINDVIKRTCSETGAILFDVHSAFVYGNGSLVQHIFFRDGIHLSDVGQTKLIDCIELSVKIVNRSPASPSNSIPADNVDRRLNQDGDVYWNRYPRRQQYYGPPLPGSPRGDFRARGPQRLHHYGTYIGSNPNDDQWTRGPRYQHYRGAPSTGFHDDVNGFRDQRRQPYRPTGENRHLYQNGNGRKWHY